MDAGHSVYVVAYGSEVMNFETVGFSFSGIDVCHWLKPHLVSHVGSAGELVETSMEAMFRIVTRQG